MTKRPTFENHLIPCFLCGDVLRVRRSKRDKPYFVCEKCGIQCFFRRQDGIRRLRETASPLRQGARHAIAVGAIALEVRALLAKRDELNVELETLRGKSLNRLGKGKDPALVFASRVLKRQRAEIEERLSALADEQEITSA